MFVFPLLRHHVGFRQHDLLASLAIYTRIHDLASHDFLCLEHGHKLSQRAVETHHLLDEVVSGETSKPIVLPEAQVIEIVISSLVVVGGTAVPVDHHRTRRRPSAPVMAFEVTVCAWTCASSLHGVDCS